MTQTDLKHIAASLPEGGKARLAEKFNCDPSKITKAFKGLVRSPKFMADLMREANELIYEAQGA